MESKCNKFHAIIQHEYLPQIKLNSSLHSKILLALGNGKVQNMNPGPWSPLWTRSIDEVHGPLIFIAPKSTISKLKTQREFTVIFQFNSKIFKPFLDTQYIAMQPNNNRVPLLQGSKAAYFTTLPSLPSKNYFLSKTIFL